MTNPTNPQLNRDTITTFLEGAAKKGWHLRPDEATEAMSLAGIKASPPGMIAGGPKDAFQLAWRAMGLAAPLYELHRAV